MNEKHEVSKPSKKRKILRVLVALIAIVFVMVGSFGFYVFQSLQPFKEKKEEVEITIPLNSSLKTIAEILEDKGVIKNNKAFYYYARYHKETEFKAGEYTLSPNMELGAIIKKLKEGKLIEKDSTFTVPEGYTVRQIAELLEEKGFTTKEEFFDALKNGDYSGIWYLKKIPTDRTVKYPLEGFLFPKTYTVEEDATAEDIVRMMLEQTAKEIPQEWMNELLKNKVTFYDAMILASIVERETVVERERPKVATVYYNRIQKGMKLQADATIQYVLDKQKSRLLYSDLELDTKYNTYKYEGLPPGPISNPGLASIKAAIFPEKHDYLFYVTKKDGSGGHYFSKTFEEHEHYIRLSKKTSN